jgi:peroxiredoxin
MKKVSMVALALMLACIGLVYASATGDGKTAAPLTIGATAPDFKLPAIDGTTKTFASLKGAKGTVVIFIATQCPISNAYNERMEKLAQDFKDKGINVIGINSNNTEPMDAVKAHAAQHHFTFTILKDNGSKIADTFGAEHTPEAYLFDANNRLVYHGRIDNSRDAAQVQSSELRDAINALLEGKAIAKAETKAFGCSIKRG